MSTTLVVYMLHFEEPIGDPSRPRMSARHYVGSYWSENRITQHRNGTSGVPIVAAFHARGIGFTVARKRPGDRTTERRIKRAGQHARHCPVCTPRPWTGGWG